MININLGHLIAYIISYTIIIFMIIIGTKYNIGWFNIKKLISIKTFFFRWIFCLLIQIIVFLITSYFYNTEDNLKYTWYLYSGVILIFYQLILISSAIKRILSMRFSKIILCIFLLLLFMTNILYIISQFTFLVVTLFIGLLPSKKSDENSEA